MFNLYALLGVQQGFRHELATNYAFLINLKTKKVVIIDAYRVLLMWRSLSATIRVGIINGHLSLICKAPSCMTNLSPHTGSLEIATAAVCVWCRMVDHTNDGHLLPRSLREQRPCAFLNVQFQIKQLEIFWVQTNLIIINHPHRPRLARININVQKSGPKHSMKHAKIRGLISFDKLSVPLDYLHYMFQHRHSHIEQ